MTLIEEQKVLAGDTFENAKCGSSQAETADALESQEKYIQAPQPHSHPMDPRNLPYWYKAYLAVLVSTVAFFSQFGGAVINSAYVPIAKALGEEVERISYATTIHTLLAAVVPMLIVPFANIWGRRAIYLFFTPIGIIGAVVAGTAKSYTIFMVGRALYGVGSGIALGLTPATICDLFPLEERGFWLGFYVLLVNNGPHVAPIVGGYIALYASWRWTLHIISIIFGALLVIMFFTLSETLFPHHDPSLSRLRPLKQNLIPSRKVIDKKLEAKAFIRPFYMLTYVVVALSGIFFGVSNMFGSILFAVTGSHIAQSLYHFNTGQTGLLMGLPLTIGCMIGEVGAGWVSDAIVRAYERRHGGRTKPEVRLFLLPASLLLAAGTISYGWSVEQKKPWIILAVCLAVAGVGAQYSSTVAYTYVTDTYKLQSAEVGACMNFIKGCFAFTTGFFALDFGEEVGYGPAWTMFACIQVFVFLVYASMWFVGPRIRAAQGTPKFSVER